MIPSTPKLFHTMAGITHDWMVAKTTRLVEVLTSNLDLYQAIVELGGVESVLSANRADGRAFFDPCCVGHHTFDLLERLASCAEDTPSIMKDSSMATASM